METTTQFLSKKSETHDSNSFIFAKPDGFEFEAGQFMFITVEHSDPDERGTRRHFTISTSPTEENLMITTKLATPGSSYKKALSDLLPGATVPIKGPAGGFYLPEDPDQPVVFLGGGIGITPFRSMIKSATDQALPTPITLIYANKTPADIVYHQEFDIWAKLNTNFKSAYTVDTPDEDWEGEVGHLNAELIRKYVPNLYKPLYYICGPQGMIDAYHSVLTNIDVVEEKIRTENFSGY